MNPDRGSGRVGLDSGEPPTGAAARPPTDLVPVQDSTLQDTSTAVAEPELDSALVTTPAPGAGAMIVFDHVRKVYDPNVVALQDVSFTIEKGEFVFIVGASGSGKSTMVRLLLKELEPTAGRIIVGGRDLGRLKRSKVPYLRRNIGCVFQDFKLLPNRTAAENVAYALKVQGESRASIRRKVPEVMTLVGLANKMNSLPDELSGGERQRVAIARALINNPPLLLADEPTGALDSTHGAEVMAIFAELHKGGQTIVLVTHDEHLAEANATRVIRLIDGTVVPADAPRMVQVQ